MSRKRIVQLLTSLAVLSCMVLPVQAAPQVNIVPLIQLLLLSPMEVVVVGSGMQGIDSDGNLIGSPFSTTDKRVCLTTQLEVFGPGTIHLKVEWRDGIEHWETTIDTDITVEGPVLLDITDCIIDADADDPPPTPAPSALWNVIVTVDGENIVEEHFEIQ